MESNFTVLIQINDDIKINNVILKCFGQEYVVGNKIYLWKCDQWKKQYCLFIHLVKRAPQYNRPRSSCLQPNALTKGLLNPFTKTPV